MPRQYDGGGAEKDLILACEEHSVEIFGSLLKLGKNSIYISRFSSFKDGNIFEIRKKFWNSRSFV